MLEVGMKAPEFTLPDKNGNMVSLTDFLGKKVVLYFTRKTIRLDVRDRLARLRSKIRKSKIKTRWLSVLARIALIRI